MKDPVSARERAAAQRARDTADRKRGGPDRVRAECQRLVSVEPITERDWGELALATRILAILDGKA